MKRALAVVIVCLLFVSMFSIFRFDPTSVKAQDGVTATTLIVPDDYSTIQAALNAAVVGDTVFVRSGTYYESQIVVSKTLSLVGEDKLTTIVDGGSSDVVITISADNVYMSGLTLQNSYGYGVVLSHSSHCTITENIMAAGNGGNGIALFDSSDYNVISGNEVTRGLIGVFLRYSCQYNTISGNEITHCGSSSTLSGGIGFMDGSDYNTIYHNNFIDNIWPVHSNLATNIWDNGYPSGGNYWSSYTGVDVYSGQSQNILGSDGIGDSPFTFSPGFAGTDVTDHYPLMTPVSISSSAPETQWSKTYGGVGDEQATSIIQTSDGGFALAGWTDSFGSGNPDFWLVRTNSEGEPLWNRTYDNHGQLDYAWGLVQTRDGGFALCGHTSPSPAEAGMDMWLVRTDSEGNAIWNVTYGGSGSDVVRALVETDDGGFILAGHTKSPEWSNGNSDVWLVKVNSTGGIEWSRNYGGPLFDETWNIIKTDDGGYAVAAFTGPGLGPYDLWLIKTDSLGIMQWNVTYGGTGDDSPFSLVQTYDGGYAIAGFTTSYGAGDRDFWLVRTGSNGQMLWNKTYGGTGLDWAYKIVQTTDGGFALAGWTNSFGAGGADFWLVHTDSEGNQLWNMTYGGSADDHAYSMVQTGDGGFALVGDTNSFGAGGLDVWLVKIGPPTRNTGTTLSLSQNTVLIDNLVTCTATVSGSNPTGTITWSSSSSTGRFSSTLTSLTSGTSSTKYSDTSSGTETITATYSGDSNNAPSSGSITLTLTRFSGIKNVIELDDISVQSNLLFWPYTGFWGPELWGPEANLFPSLDEAFSIQQNFYVYVPVQSGVPRRYWVQNAIIFENFGILGWYAQGLTNIYDATTNLPPLTSDCLILQLPVDNPLTGVPISVPSTCTIKSYISNSQVILTDNIGFSYAWDIPGGNGISTQDSYIDATGLFQFNAPELVLVGPAGGCTTQFQGTTRGSVQSYVQLDGQSWTNSLDEKLAKAPTATNEKSQGLDWSINIPNSASFSNASSPNNMQGIFFLPVLTSAIENGGTSSDQSALTDVKVTIGGSSAADGKTVTITTVQLDQTQVTSLGVVNIDMTPAAYYDVNIQGISDGMATVYITNKGVSSATIMEYWDGTQWVAASDVSISGDTIQGDIPVSALSGTLIAIGPLNGVVITFNEIGVGSDFNGTIVVIDGNPYNASAFPLSFYWPVNSLHTYAFQTPLTVSAAGEQYVWTGTYGLSSSQSDSMNVTTYGSIGAIYETQYDLNVTSVRGVPTPSVGWFNAGTQITASVASPTSGGVGIQYVCTGWSGTGSVPTSGSSSSVTFTISSPSSITWNWKTQYQVSFTVSPSKGGLASPSTSAYYDAGSKLSINATANSGYAFWAWSSSSPLITFTNSSSASTTATINGPGAITATFALLVSGNKQITLTGSNNVVIITSGNNIINAAQAVATTVIKTGAGNNIINLGAGNNIVTETAGGNDIITAGNGNNTITITGNGNYQITTGSGNDKIQITGDGNSIINAGDGSNAVTVSGKGNNQITTGSGNDVVVAGNGNNIIKTGAGNDTITVGNGNNNIDGGAGYDVCIHGTGHNTILNCEKTIP